MIRVERLVESDGVAEIDSLILVDQLVKAEEATEVVSAMKGKEA